MFNILVVEDDKHARRLMEAVLRRANFTVYTAENGNIALDVMDTQHIDLIVLDIMMPGKNGYELTQELRENGFTTPILMTTAKQLMEDKKKAFQVGTDDYLTKPIDTEEMILRIKALLRRSRI